MDTDTAPAMPDMKEVESSNISHIGYDAPNSTLHVKFRGGAHYSHTSVSPEAHAAFMESDSKGKHYNAAFKNKPEFPHTKLSVPQPVEPPHAA